VLVGWGWVPGCWRTSAANAANPGGQSAARRPPRGHRAEQAANPESVKPFGLPHGGANQSLSTDKKVDGQCCPDTMGALTSAKNAARLGYAGLNKAAVNSGEGIVLALYCPPRAKSAQRICQHQREKPAAIKKTPPRTLKERRPSSRVQGNTTNGQKVPSSKGSSDGVHKERRGGPARTQTFIPRVVEGTRTKNLNRGPACLALRGSPWQS